MYSVAHGADHTPETSNACPDPDPNCDSHLGFTWLLQVINRTRDLARMIVGIIPDDTIEGGVHARMVGYVVAFCITMKVSCVMSRQRMPSPNPCRLLRLLVWCW